MPVDIEPFDRNWIHSRREGNVGCIALLPKSEKTPASLISPAGMVEIPGGKERCPVVYVNLDDVKVYAAWASKRLPTEIEWQYAAQGTDMRTYPWGDDLDTTRCNYHLNYSTPVDSFPQGASPFGVEEVIITLLQASGM